MAYKTLGQIMPAATTLTDLYSATGEAVSATLFICNQAASGETVRVAITPGGGTIAQANYVFYDVPLEPKETKTYTVGHPFANTDKMRVYSTGGNVSFTLGGREL